MPSLNSGKKRRAAEKVVSPRKRLKTKEYLAMMSGPQVDLYVGPDRKHYRLPKDLLCFYSSVFDGALNGHFREAREQVMELPEDDVEDFDVLEEFVVKGHASEILSCEEAGEDAAKKCIHFLKYADKYDLGDVSKVIETPLRNALMKYGSGVFEAAWIDVVFDATPAGNPIRQLMAEAALSFGGMGNNNQTIYAVQEASVDGFAYELLKAVRKATSQSGISWHDPLQGNPRFD